ncbi:MAG: flagellar basal body-associated FliL family protein [Dehalobacterium sp.]
MNRNNGEGPRKKSGRKFIIIGVMAFFLAFAAGAFAMMKGDFSGTEINLSGIFKSKEEIASLTFDGIQVNLADQNMVRYLSTSIVIEYMDNEKLAHEIEANGYRLKDAIIEVLRGKSVSELDTGEEITKVKEEILQAVNQKLTLGKAKSVYFEEFLIQ